MIIGYGRIRHKEDILTGCYNYGYKEGLLKSNGAEEIFIDIDTPATTINRTQLKEAINTLNKGDVLLAASSYDLYRDINVLYEIYTLVQKKGATLKIINEDNNVISLNIKIYEKIINQI